MKTTSGRLSLATGLGVLPVLILPHGSEKYQWQLRHIAMWIAKMIRLCDAKHLCDDNGELIKFYNVLNMDRGTAMNANKVLYHIVYYIKDELNIPQNQQIFTNENGIKFNFCKYYLHVCINIILKFIQY